MSMPGPGPASRTRPPEGEHAAAPGSKLLSLEREQGWPAPRGGPPERTREPARVRVDTRTALVLPTLRSARLAETARNALDLGFEARRKGQGPDGNCAVMPSPAGRPLWTARRYSLPARTRSSACARTASAASPNSASTRLATTSCRRRGPTRRGCSRGGAPRRLAAPLRPAAESPAAASPGRAGATTTGMGRQVAHRVTGRLQTCGSVPVACRAGGGRGVAVSSVRPGCSPPTSVGRGPHAAPGRSSQRDSVADRRRPLRSRTNSATPRGARCALLSGTLGGGVWRERSLGRCGAWAQD